MSGAAPGKLIGRGRDTAFPGSLVDRAARESGSSSAGTRAL